MLLNDHDDILCHFGIEGQKWGVRRYQNPDGTLTPAGRARYFKGERLTKEGLKKYAVRRSITDLDDKVIPKGQTVYRITAKNEELPERGVYIYQEMDRSNIKSITPWLSNVRGVKNDDMVERSYKTVSDLKIPSQQKAYNVAYDLINQNKDVRDSVIKSATYEVILERSGSGYSKWLKDWTDYDPNFIDLDSIDNKKYNALVESAKKEIADEYKKKTGIEYNSSLYGPLDFQARTAISDLARGNKMVKDILDVSGKIKVEGLSDPKYKEDIQNGNKFIANSIAASDKFKEAYFKKLSDLGYNAVYDDNMIASGTRFVQEAYEPLVVFDKDSIEQMSVSNIKSKDIANAERQSTIYSLAVKKDQLAKSMKQSK